MPASHCRVNKQPHNAANTTLVLAAVILPQCLEILVTLRRDLDRRRLLKAPLVYISPSLGNETQRLREYVRRLQANLAETPGGRTAGGSHALGMITSYLPHMLYTLSNCT